jgi:hypothetical protein
LLLLFLLLLLLLLMLLSRELALRFLLPRTIQGGMGETKRGGEGECLGTGRGVVMQP